MGRKRLWAVALFCFLVMFSGCGRQANVGMSFGNGEITIEGGPFHEEDIAMVKNIVSRIAYCGLNRQTGDDLGGIVWEKLGAFFAGDKTARETAEIIQNRAQTYLDEHY